MRVLYAGDSERGGPANYLLGILRYNRARITHVPPSRKLSSSLFKDRFDVIVLSDFSKKNTPAASEKAILSQTEKGCGLLMVGGWGSFSGPFGGWRGSKIETLLPVRCLAHDDRLNFPGGAHIILKRKHSLFDALNFKDPPVICGVNQIRPQKNSNVLLKARRIKDQKEFPLLIINSNPERRIAAFTTDLAPHWCGGLVDWGSRRMRLKVTGKIQVEVGDQYVQFVSSLLRWLARIK